MEIPTLQKLKLSGTPFGENFLKALLIKNVVTDFAVFMSEISKQALYGLSLSSQFFYFASCLYIVIP